MSHPTSRKPLIYWQKRQTAGDKTCAAEHGICEVAPRRGFPSAGARHQYRLGIRPGGYFEAGGQIFAWHFASSREEDRK